MRLLTLLPTLTLLGGVAFAAQPAREPNGANPSDLATPKAADGAIIDKTRPASGASTQAPRFLRHAQKAASEASAPADGRKRVPRPPPRGSSSAM